MKKTLKDLIEYIRDNGLVWVNHDECIEFDPIDKIVSDFMEEKNMIDREVDEKISFEVRLKEGLKKND